MTRRSAPKPGLLHLFTGKYLHPQRCSTTFQWEDPAPVGTTVSFTVQVCDSLFLLFSSCSVSFAVLNPSLPPPLSLLSPSSRSFISFLSSTCFTYSASPYCFSSSFPFSSSSSRSLMPSLLLLSPLPSSVHPLLPPSAVFHPFLTPPIFPLSARSMKHLLHTSLFYFFLLLFLLLCRLHRPGLPHLTPPPSPVQPLLHTSPTAVIHRSLFLHVSFISHISVTPLSSYFSSFLCASLAFSYPCHSLAFCSSSFLSSYSASFTSSPSSLPYSLYSYPIQP